MSYLDNCQVNIVDIGASGGIHPKFKKVINNLKGILFEPDPREFSRLKGSAPNDHIVLNTALSEMSGEVDFHLCKKQEVSSIYLPNNEFLINFPDLNRFSITKTIKLIADTLDNQLDKNGIKDIDFIKSDTEGSELSILKGAENVLHKVVGLELEIYFAPVRVNQPLFHDVNKYLIENNFSLVNIRRFYWKRLNSFYNFGKGEMIFCDALYFRTPENICQLPEINERKIIACFLLLLTYNYLNLAEALYILAKQQKLITEDTINEIHLLLEKYRRRIVLADFKGRQRIYNILMRIANTFSNHTYDREL